MNQDAVLERLYVELLAKTDGLEAALKGATQAARDAVKEMEAAAAATGQSVGADLAAGFNVARESTGQFTRDLTAGMRQAGAGTEQIARDITQLNARMRENHEAVRAGEQSREQYRRTLEQQRGQLQNLIGEYNRAARGAGQYDQALGGVADESKELDDVIRGLSERVRTQRNLWAGRITDDEQFRASTERLHKEMRELAENTDLTGAQMRKLTGDMAYAQRGLDSVNKIASRGGLAWTAQIGIADAFGNSLRNLGPAGNTAAMGIASLAPVFMSLRSPLSLTTESLAGFVRNLGGLVRMLPLLTAAAGVGAAAGLWRLANAHAELANSIDLATYRTGLSIEAYQELRHAATQTGVDVSILDTTMQRLQRRAADAHAGNENLRKSFNQLGVSLTDADGNLRGTEELLGQVADGLSQVENNAERLRLAFAVFDTEGGRLLPLLSQGSEGIAELRREARELGLVISGDTVMSLVEFSNEVNEMQAQFRAASVEITAAFLPVLRDVLIPLIQRFVIPWFQNVATAVGDFADKLIDTGPAGEEFRSAMVKSLIPIARFGDAVYGITMGFGGFVSYVSGGAAQLGVYLGHMSTSLRGVMELFLPFQNAILGLTTGNISALTSAVAEIARVLKDPESILPWAQIAAEASAAGAEYFDKALDRTTKGAAALTRALGEDAGYDRLFADVFASLSDAVTRGASTGLSDMLNVPEVSEFGGAVGGAVGEGIRDGVNTGFADALTESRSWIARILGEWEIGEKDADTARELLVQAAANNRAALHDLYSAGTFTGEEVDVLLGKINLVETALNSLPAAVERTAVEFQRFSFPQPDEGEGGANLLPYSIERAEAEAARAERIADEAERAELARLERLRAAYEQHYDLQERLADWFPGFQAAEAARQGAAEAQAQADGLRQVYAAMWEIDEANRAAAESARRWRMVMFGRSFNQLAPDEGQGSDLQDVWLAHRDAMQLAEAQSLALGDSFDLNAAQAAALQTTINALLRAGVDPLSVGVQNLVADLNELNDANVDVSVSVDADALRGEFDNVREAIETLTGTGASEFDDLRARLQDVVSKLREMGEEVDGVEALLAALDAAEATQNLVDTLGDVQSALHEIGSAAGGAFGQLLTGLGDAVGIARQFASGDIAGGIVSTISTIVGGVSDIINANQEWARGIDQLADRYSNLQRETIEALSKTRTETRWFLFIPYQVRVIDESATNEAMRVAGTFMSALENALTSADFEADFELGLDRILQAELIKGFMMTPAVQDAIVAFTQAIERGDWSGARRAYDGLTDATRRQNELLREQFPELYRIVDKARDYADAIRRAADETRNLRQSIAAGQLERAFATGVIGLEEYARQLEAVSRTEIGLNFTRQLDDLDAQIAQAIEEGADAGFIAALQDQKIALQDAYREALEQGAFDAAESIKQILGTTIGDLQGVMRDALGSSDALTAWGEGLRTTTRNALIAAFLEGEIMKPLLNNLSEAITAAVMDGVITPAELERIQELSEGVTGPMAQFIDMLDEVGLGLGDLDDNVNALNDSMRNVPTVFKATQAAMDSVNASAPRYVPQAQPAAAQGYSGQNYTLGTNPVPMDGRPIVYITGDVYGFEDFEQKVSVAVANTAERRNVSSYGRS